MPAKVPLKEIKDKPLQAIQRTDRRNMVNAIKLATYNAERLLARKFFRHYRDPRDWLTIFRSFFHLSGSITYKEDRCWWSSTPRTGRTSGRRCRRRSRS